MTDLFRLRDSRGMFGGDLQVRQGWPLLGGNTIPYLNAVRDSRNEEPFLLPGRAPWPRQKNRFDQIVAEHGGRTPDTFAFIVDGRVEGGQYAVGETAGSLLRQLPPGHYFCKPNRGGNGIGAARLDISAAGLLINGETRTVADVESVLSSRPYLVQGSLQPLQHPDMARFHPATVNTVRIVTFDDGVPVPIAAIARLGTVPAVDNWSAGGVAVRIDLETGMFDGFGTIKSGLKQVAAHPVSGVRLGGFRVPELDAALELVCALHQHFAVRTLGWDIAILRDGPCIIEANRPWDIYFSGQEPRFLQQFMDFHLPADTGPAKRWELSGDFADRETVRHWVSNFVGAARASGRLEELTHERMVVTIAGAPNALEAAMRKHSPARFGLVIRKITATAVADRVPRGLDLTVSFAEIPGNPS